MHNLLIKVAKFFPLLALAVLLVSCSSAKTKADPALIWKVEVSGFQIKDTLKAVQVVTQYNGTKEDVAHQQSPAAGNTYAILHVTISKTGTPSTPFDWESLVIQDGSGAAYRRSPNDTFLEQYNYTPRITGLTIRFGVNDGWLCFEIPKPAATEKLTLIYKAEGSQQSIPLNP